MRGKKKIRFVFFDHGGTLSYIKRDTPEIVLDVLREHGYSFTPEQVYGAFEVAEAYWREKFEPLPRGQRSKYFVDYHVKLLGHLGVKQRTRGVARQIDAEWTDRAGFTLYPDTVPCLEELRRRHTPMGIISQNLRTVEEFRHFQLRMEGIEHYFSVIVTTESIGYDKPDPQLYIKAAELTGFTPSEIMHVGDHFERDVQGARTAGMHAVMIDRTGKAGRYDCEGISSLLELPNLLD